MFALSQWVREWPFSVVAACAVASLALGSTSAAQCSDEAVLRHLDAGTVAPVLRTPKGAAVIGGGFSLRVFDAAPSSTGILFYSAFENPVFDPVLGATVWPEPPWLTKSFGTSAQGASGAQFNTTVVTDDLCGAFATFQAVVVDAGHPSGFTITNAVRLRVGIVTEPVFEPLPGNGISSTFPDVNDVATVDVNGDALTDLLAATSSAFIVTPRLLDGSFGAAQTYTQLGGATRVPLVADMNGDTDSDLVDMSGDVGILFLDAAGGVLGAVSYSAGGNVTDGAVGDIDLDGFLDAVFTLEGGDLGWLASNGGGGLSFPQNIDVGAAASQVEVAHMDHDGLLDLVVSTTKTVVALGNGDGTFAALSPIGPVGLGLLSVFDLDLDGELDVVGFSGKNLGVQRGNGDGTLQPIQTHLAVTAGKVVKDFVFDDLDGDGRLDLFAIAGHFSVDDVFVSAGLPGGAFEPAVRYRAIDPNAIAVLDEDVDGALDVAVFGEFSPTLFGKGDGTLYIEGMVAVEGGWDTVIAADLDGNALDDVIVLDQSSDAFSVLLGTPSGPVLSTTVSLTPNPIELVTGDVNGDQILDLLSTDALVTGIRCFPGDGSGGFGPPIVTPSSFKFGAMGLGDFDGDGVLDIATKVVNSFPEPNTAGIMLGNGDGTFGPWMPLPISPNAFMGPTGRVDGDAHLDLVFSLSGAIDKRIVLLGNGDGTFVALPDEIAPFSTLMRLADLDLDGHLDLISRHFDSFFNDLRVELGAGDGTFAEVFVFSLGSGSGIGLVVADFDENGIPDVITGTQGSGGPGTVRWFRGNGDGTLANVLNVPVGATTSNVVAGNFDGDGIRDVAAIDPAFGGVWFLLNQVGE